MKGRKLATELFLGFTLWQWLSKKVLLKENHKEKAKPNICTYTQPRPFHHPPERTQIVPSPLHQTTAQLNIERTIKPNAAIHRWQKSDMVTQGYFVARGELIAAASRVWEP